MPKRSEKKYSVEDFFASPILGCEGVYYYNPKIVGINFKSNLNPSLSRRSVISTFLDFYSNRVVLLCDDQITNGIIEAVKQDKVWHLRDSIQDLIKLVREPDNKYDRNAIAIFVKVNTDCLDVGYIPKKHAKVIKEDYSKFFLVGASGDGAGLRLDIILYKFKKRDMFAEPKRIPELKKIQSTFLSLKKMRKSLEM